MNKLCSLGAALALSIASTSALSASVTLNFDMTLAFDPSQEVAAGAITAGDVVGSVFGGTVGSSGELPVSFSITYESTSTATDQGVYGGYNYAIYLNSPITAAQLDLNGSTIQADMTLINTNSASSDLQWEPGCDGIAPFCSAGTPPPTAASNGISIYNDVPTLFIQKPGGGFYELNNVDSVSMGLGFTGASPEFFPAFSTGLVGDISVDGFFVDFAQQDLVDNTALPADANFFDPANINLLEATLRFEGANISDIDLTGNVVIVPDVPLPPAIWLFGSGLFGLIGISGRKRALKRQILKRLFRSAFCVAFVRKMAI